jgi:tetratricopeptide (TPR) repeat protein
MTESDEAARPASPPPSPFTTTSDVMNSLNTVMERLYAPELKEKADNKPAFELQRRLPDGTTRQAFGSEIKAADYESKLKQVANHVAGLPDDDAKRAFGAEQRQYGNKVYAAGDYEQAIDVYMTCLVALPPLDRSSISLQYLQILNNLAQAALQLQWYRKSQDFCQLALDDLPVESHDSLDTERRLAVSKIYYKRGKARRHRGDYAEATADLQQALRLLSTDAATESKATEASRKTIQKELQAVVRGAAVGRQNLQRQQKALQQVWGDSSVSQAKKTATSIPMAPVQPLYETPRGSQRAYSRLRARGSTQEKADEDEVLPLSYRQIYLQMVGRVAQKLLEWIGDDGEAGDPKQD